MPNGTCVHHEAVEVRLDTNEENMRTIKKMFWWIILGLVLSVLKPNVVSLVESNTAPTHAQEHVGQTR